MYVLVVSLMMPANASLTPQNAAAPQNQKPVTQPAVPSSRGQQGPDSAVNPGDSSSQNESVNKTGAPSGDDKSNCQTGSTWCKVLYFPGLLSAAVSLIGVVVTIVLYFLVKRLNTQWADRTAVLNRQWADRTVKLEAQKLLLEVNKQYASNPDLWAVYDVHFDELPPHKQKDKKLQDALRAVAFMKLNIFEIVFSVHPTGPEADTWKRYFKDSLERCSSIRKILRVHRELYNENLLRVYDEYRSGLPDEKEYPDATETPTPAAIPVQFDEKTLRKLQAFAATLHDPDDDKPENHRRHDGFE
jgi:hypothetical protein